MIDMLPTSDPGGRPGGITAALPTSPRAASAASVGIDAASSGVRPPSASIGSPAQPPGPLATNFTCTPTQFLGSDSDQLYGGTRAHNRAMGEFCGDDDRMIAVGFVPLDDPARAEEAVDEALAFGCGAILVPSHPPRTHSPTHPDLD